MGYAAPLENGEYAIIITLEARPSWRRAKDVIHIAVSMKHAVVMHALINDRPATCKEP